MKKITLLVLFTFIASVLYADTVPRQKVIVEIGTGTWCVFCPGAAMGAEDLINNGHDVAIIKYHVGDSFSNSFSSARTSYYGMSGYPTTVFDGQLTHVGGNPNNSIYPTYLPLYNQSIAVESPFILDMSVQHVSGLQYEAEVVITHVADFTASNLVLHLAVTETDIPFNWFNQTHVKDVLRLMVPNQNGTSLDFSDTDEITLNLTFNLQSAWEEENMNVVAFVQDVPTKVIFQGEIKPLISDEPDTYSVIFDVVDLDGEPITDAVITLGGQENDPGDYTFHGLVPRGYNYTVQGDCSPTVSGHVVVVDEDVHVEVELETVMGDANGDGLVNVLDVIFIADYFASEGDVEDFCFENADVNQDGTINALDIILTIHIFIGD